MDPAVTPPGLPTSPLSGGDPLRRETRGETPPGRPSPDPPEWEPWDPPDPRDSPMPPGAPSCPSSTRGPPMTRGARLPRGARVVGRTELAANAGIAAPRRRAPGAHRAHEAPREPRAAEVARAAQPRGAECRWRCHTCGEVLRSWASAERHARDSIASSMRTRADDYSRTAGFTAAFAEAWQGERLPNRTRHREIRSRRPKPRSVRRDALRPFRFPSSRYPLILPRSELV
jgi:hypothetical protein